MDTIGNRIKKLRKKNNLTQEELGKKLFFTDKTISSWENNRTIPDINSITKLSNILKCSISYLLYGNKLQNNCETEIKIKVTYDEYLSIINNIKQTSKFIEKTKEYDTYYKLKNNNTNWLRIRETGNKIILSYKKLDKDNKEKKYEVLIDNKENLNNILTNLNYKILTQINKERIIYIYKDKYEIVFDNVENLGLFIELKIHNHNTLALNEYDNLLKIATHFNINLNNLITKKYPELSIN